MKGGPCSFRGCGAKSITAKNPLCSGHYGQKNRGEQLRPIARPTVEERFWAKVAKDGDCWVWIAAQDGRGYGQFGAGLEPGVSTAAHRRAWIFLRGEIPDGLELDHLCRNRLCVNPWHLDPVTSRVNTLRGESPSAICAQATHCQYGHEFTPENTAYERDGRSRACRACRRRRRAAAKSA